MKPAGARVARNVAWLAAGEVVLKGALFAAGVLVARGLGPAAMGAFTVSYGAAILVMLLLAAGQVEVVIREAARRPEAVRALYRLSRGWQRRVALLVVPVTVLGAALVPDATLRWTLLGFLPYAWLRSALITAGAAFKGLDRMEVEVVGRIVELGVALLILGSLAMLAAPVWTTGVAFSAGGAAGLTVVLWQLRKLVADAPFRLEPAFLAREGAVFVLLGLGLQALLRIDTFLMAALGVPKDAIGRYGVAAAPVWGLLGAAQLVAVATYPTLAKAAAAGRLRVRRVLVLGLGGAAAGAVLAALLTAVKRPLIRIVFGPQYLGSVPLMGVLAWALPGACVMMVVGVAVAACGRQRWSLATQGGLLAVGTVANLAVIPRWGVGGCAAVAVVVWTLGLLGSLAIAGLAARHPVRVEHPVFAGSELE